MKLSTLWVSGIIILILVIGWLMIAPQSSEAPTDIESEEASLLVPAPGFEDVDEMIVAPNAQQAELTTEVEYTRQGFFPEIITITRGTEVSFVNVSGEPMWVASNPHPVHTDYSAFDQLGTGNSYSFTFINAGVYNYHNHVNPRRGGKIIVE